MVLFGDSNSFKRRWLRQGAAWCKQFRLDKSNPGLGSWLEAAQNGTRIGCKVCSALGRKNVWGRIGVSSRFMLQCCAFERHENSDSHTQAVQTYLQRLGLAGPTKEAKDTQSPSIEEFSQLIDRVITGKLVNVGRKTKQMLWCLMEAIKTLDQATLGKALGVSLEMNGIPVC